MNYPTTAAASESAPAAATLAPCAEYLRLLSIAGSDSGGGAGIQADLKTFAALGCFGTTAITALTAQNTRGVRAIHAVPLAMLADQIDAVVEDIGVDAVKIGMLHSVPTIETVAAAIDRHRLHPVVLDPVMVATSGAALIDPSAVAALVRLMFPRARLVTPNVDEAALIVERALHTEADMAGGAQQLVARPREHDNDPSICRGRRGEEGEGARTTGGARHHDGPLQGAGLAPSIAATL